jgi:hypothetical protein
MDNAFGCRDADGTRWIRRDSTVRGAEAGVNHGAIAIKTHQGLRQATALRIWKHWLRRGGHEWVRHGVISALRCALRRL